MGPAGPAGATPFYIAGSVLSIGTVSYGGGFTVVRESTGTYKISIDPATSTEKFLVTVVTPMAVNTIARIVKYEKTGSPYLFHVTTIEIRDRATGAVMNSDFHFITLVRS
jgi:hypothetical protein